jgi:hypothetical protein
VLYIRISLLSVRTQTHLSFGMLTVLFSSDWLHILGQVEYPLLVLIVPHTLAFLSNNVSAYLILLQKRLDSCDDSGITFWLKVIKLCPPNSISQLCVSSSYRYNPIPPHTHSHQHSIFCFPLIVHPEFQMTPPWDLGFLK